MSTQIDRIYKLAFRKNFTNYEGNFPINRQLQLGDYGVMKNGYFSKLGNIKNEPLNLAFDILKDPSPGHETFKSSNSINFSSIAKGDILANGAAAAKASVEIGFTQENAVFFSSAEVRYNEIQNIRQLGDQLLSLYHQGNWKKEYYVVTRLIEGKNSVLIISGSSGCKVNIEAKSDVKNIDLGNATIDLGFKNVQQTAYEVILDDVCQLGMGLSRVYDTLFIQPKFKSVGNNAVLFAGLDHTNTSAVAFGDVIPESFDVTV
jgi:hypothetical protein